MRNSVFSKLAHEKIANFISKKVVWFDPCCDYWFFNKVRSDFFFKYTVVITNAICLYVLRENITCFSM
jgi:hypothetical protein